MATVNDAVVQTNVKYLAEKRSDEFMFLWASKQRSQGLKRDIQRTHKETALTGASGRKKRTGNTPRTNREGEVPFRRPSE